MIEGRHLTSLASCNQGRRAGELEFCAGAVPGNGLRAAGSDDGERRLRRPQRNRSGGRRPSCRFRKKRWVRRRARRCEFRFRSGSTMRTNSTLVWYGKSGCDADLCADRIAMAWPRREVRRCRPGSRSADCRWKPRRLQSIRRIARRSSWLNVGTPMPVVTSTVYRRGPPRYGRRARRRRWRSQLVAGCEPSFGHHAATQRVPLPLISAMEPSALCRRMRPDWPGPGRKNSMPSAPMPVLRAHRRRVRSAQSWSCCRVFGDDQKVVAAGVGLGKGDQSSSGSRKVRSASMRALQAAFVQALVLLLGGGQRKLTRWRSPMASVSMPVSRSPALSMASRMDCIMRVWSRPRAS